VNRGDSNSVSGLTGSHPLAAVIEALRFDDATTGGLSRLDEEALGWCDRAQLTLELGLRRMSALPAPVQERIARNLASNRERTRRLEGHFAAAIAALARRGLDPVVLKGFAHTPDFIADPARRPQYDIDLWLPYEEALRAREALAELGYETFESTDRHPTDHLPVLVQKTGYRWRGDWYDPDIPPMIDLHFRLWDRKTEGFEIPGWQDFRGRRVRKESATAGFAAMETCDALGFAAMHALRHLLRGSVKVYSLYEIASFLEAHENDAGFWQRWRSLHQDTLRRIEAITFEIARKWFGCRVHGLVHEEIAALPAGVRTWLHQYAMAPLEGLYRPNKHELWLNLELVDSRSDARRVLLRRLVPMRAPPAGGSTTLLPDSQVTWRVRLQRLRWRAARLIGRAWHHTRVLPSVGTHGIAWWLRGSGIQPGFLRYLAATCAFSAGVFVFFILYNLHLLGLGFREDFLGQVSAAMTFGSIAGTLPAGWVAARFGLRTALLGVIAAVSVTSALRATLVTPSGLLLMAFAEGLSLSGWAVAAMPAVSEYTTPEGRARGFSLMAVSGISMGVIGGMVGGRLPGWVSGVSGAGAHDSRYIAILIGALIIAAALVPAWGLRFTRPAERHGRSYPTSAFVMRFFGALAVWQFATGAFKPFFNAWLARHLGAATATIGNVFSLGQLTQVLALLAAPFVLRRMGVVTGVAAMMTITGLMLMVSAAATALPLAAAGYVLYMAAQYMSEPGLFTLLMNRVPESQRSGASAMNFLVVYVAHASAALAAGWAYAQFGYPSVMAVAGLVGLFGGWLFWRLLRGIEDG
jgi:MFS family permease